MKRSLADGWGLSYGKAQRTIKGFSDCSLIHSVSEQKHSSSACQLDRLNIRHRERVWRGKHIPDCPLRTQATITSAVHTPRKRWKNMHFFEDYISRSLLLDTIRGKNNFLRKIFISINHCMKHSEMLSPLHNLWGKCLYIKGKKASLEMSSGLIPAHHLFLHWSSSIQGHHSDILHS